MNSRTSLHARPGASKPTRKQLTGSTSSLVNSRSLIPTGRYTAGPAGSSRAISSKTTSSSSQLVPSSLRQTNVAPSRRHGSISSSSKPDSSVVPAVKTNRVGTRSIIGSRTQVKTQSKAPIKGESHSIGEVWSLARAKKGKPDSDGLSAPGLRTSAAPAAAPPPAAQLLPPAAVVSPRVQQLEQQLSRRQLQLSTAGDDLRHATRCFDAAMVMVNYLSNECNPFMLKKDLSALQSRASSIQLALDEAQAGQRRLQTSLAAAESDSCLRQQLHVDQLRCAATAASEQLAGERAAWGAERQLLETRHAEQLQLTEEEGRQLHEQKQLLEKQQSELKRALGQSNNTKIQVLSGRVESLEQEVVSLNAVLELKSGEVAELRRGCAELQELRRERDQLEERVGQHRSRAEDLSVQLRQRAEAERHLVDENRKLREFQDLESRTNKRLSMENEQLQYKLHNQSQSSSDMLSRSASFRSPRSYTRSISESPSNDIRCDPNSPLKSCSSACGRHRCRRSPGGGGRMDDPPVPTPPPSPHVRGVVEKSDSISWVLELESCVDAVDQAIRHRHASSDSDEQMEASGMVYEMLPSSAPASLHGSLMMSTSVSGDHAGVMHDIPESAMELAEPAATASGCH